MATGQRTTPADVAAPDALSVIRSDAGDAYRYRLDVYRIAHVDNLQARSAEALAALAELIEAARDVAFVQINRRAVANDLGKAKQLRLRAALARCGGVA